MDADSFLAFRDRLWHAFKVPRDEEAWPGGPAVQVLFDIVEGTENPYVFDFAELRGTQDLLLAAVLLNDWHERNVVFLTATAYYAMQAVRFARRYESACVAKLGRLTIGVAGVLPLATLREAHVICHHGRVYPLPAEIDVSRKRIIVQRFPGEDVPHDTRSLSALVHSNYDSN